MNEHSGTKLAHRATKIITVRNQTGMQGQNSWAEFDLRPLKTKVASGDLNSSIEHSNLASRNERTKRVKN